MKKSYMSMLEEACKAREDLDEARSEGKSQRRVGKLETIYGDKVQKIIEYGSNLPPKNWEPIERALKSLGF